MTLFQCLPLDRTICITYSAAGTTLNGRDFNAGFDPKLSVHAVTAGGLVSGRDGLQSTL